MAHMQWPRRVGGNIFHIYFLPQPHGRAAKFRTRGQDRAHGVLPHLVGQPQVQKPRPRHLCTGDPRILSQTRGQHLRNIARLPLRGLGQYHSRVRRHITMRGIAWRLHRHGLRVQILGQIACALKLGNSGEHKLTNFGENLHGTASLKGLRRFTTAIRGVNAIPDRIAASVQKISCLRRGYFQPEETPSGSFLDQKYPGGDMAHGGCPETLYPAATQNRTALS